MGADVLNWEELKTGDKVQQSKRKWFVCDPALNSECQKKRCFLYGGPCELTSKAECAVKDGNGEPAEVDPRERLKEKIRARKAGTGPFHAMLTFK